MQFNFECYLYLVVYMIVRFQFMMLTELQLIIFSAIDLLVDVCAYGFACLLASCDYSAEVELDCPHFIPIEVQILCFKLQDVLANLDIQFFCYVSRHNVYLDAQQKLYIYVCQNGLQFGTERVVPQSLFPSFFSFCVKSVMPHVKTLLYQVKFRWPDRFAF